MQHILNTITPDVIALIAGFALRHFLMPFFSGKETSSLLKYLKAQQETKEQRAELKYQLAEVRCWLETHEKSCPYVKKEIREAKEILAQIIKKGEK
jgi:hypothetical protein